jgi:excisionase family DNA binding protein
VVKPCRGEEERVTCEICGCPEARWLSTETVAAQLDCNPRTVRRMIQRGELDGMRLRGRWRVDHESLDDYVSAESVRYGGVPEFGRE